MPTSPILKPALALVVWTQVVMVWLYARRIPALEKLKAEGKFNLDKMSTATKDQFNAVVPAPARWVADNYTHLMEHPTIFYALTFYIDRANYGSPIMVKLAWGYVGLRVVHSFVQGCGNAIMVRFSVFISSTAVFAAMTGIVVRNELLEK
jgi:hypothetical protein